MTTSVTERTTFQFINLSSFLNLIFLPHNNQFSSRSIPLITSHSYLNNLQRWLICSSPLTSEAGEEKLDQMEGSQESNSALAVLSLWRAVPELSQCAVSPISTMFHLHRKTVGFTRIFISFIISSPVSVSQVTLATIHRHLDVNSFNRFKSSLADMRGPG